jgi:hypothetical protein
MYDYVKRYHAPRYISYRYYFVNYTVGDSDDPPSLYPTQPFRDYFPLAPTLPPRWQFSVDLLAKFFFVLNYSLENTSTRWIYRGSDDCFINFPKLWPFLDRLESRYDPLNEVVFLGNCIPAGRPSRSFLQGGSGYLLSRFSASRIAPLAAEAFRQLNETDDILTAWLLDQVGFGAGNATSPAFCGHFFKFQEYRLDRGDFRGAPRCPRVMFHDGSSCRPFQSPVNDIIFFHEYHKQPIWQTRHRAEVAFNLPSVVHWYMAGTRPMLCMAKNRRVANLM